MGKTYSDFETGMTRAAPVHHQRSETWDESFPRGVASVGIWYRNAACKGKKATGQALLKLCDRCPVRLDCLDEAMRLNKDHVGDEPRGGLRSGQQRKLFLIWSNLDRS